MGISSADEFAVLTRSTLMMLVCNDNNNNDEKYFFHCIISL